MWCRVSRTETPKSAMNHGERRHTGSQNVTQNGRRRRPQRRCSVATDHHPKAAAGGLDQRPGGQDEERDQISLNSKPECLKVVDTYRPPRSPARLSTGGGGANEIR
jgi:hypothetical protein